VTQGPRLVPYAGQLPQVHPDAFVADGVILVGAVSVAAGASVWFGSVLRADGKPIAVGEGSNVQDGCVLHADPDFPVHVGAGVSLGHGAVVHGCTVGDDVLVGMGAVVLNGARVGAGSLIAAGTVVREGTEIPAASLVAGVPGQVRREVTDTETARIRDGAASYAERAAEWVRQLERGAAG